MLPVMSVLLPLQAVLALKNYLYQCKWRMWEFRSPLLCVQQQQGRFKACVQKQALSQVWKDWALGTMCGKSTLSCACPGHLLWSGGYVCLMLDLQRQGWTQGWRQMCQKDMLCLSKQAVNNCSCSSVCNTGSSCSPHTWLALKTIELFRLEHL